MEEELHYASVVFKNGNALSTAVIEEKEEETVYAQVKIKELAAPPDDEAAAQARHIHVVVVSFWLLFILLVGGIIAIVFLNTKLSEQRATLSEVTAQMEQLTSQKAAMERHTDALRRERDGLDWTLNVIMDFENFPVSEFCPQKVKCNACRGGWIHFQDKCYLFYNSSSPWKTWEQSRQSCQQRSTDLVVIESLQEQKFISDHIEKYFDMYHGYWIGLEDSKDSNNWRWVDGTNDTLRYWMTEHLGKAGLFTLMIPGRSVTASWYKADGVMQNKFICEGKALIKSS